MNYRINPKNGDKVSILAFGCMRFHKNEDEVRRQVAHAIDMGINYFDTAYIYPNSEAVLGRVLPKEHRGKVFIATKLPPYFVKKYEDFDKIFNTELSRLQTDYIDYYLMHMIADAKEWKRLSDLGAQTWLKQKKQEGKIRNAGFSYHGGVAEFKKLVDAYDWDFTMLQYNFLDEFNQAGYEGVSYAASKGLPVMVMEPLRGGRLAVNQPEEVMKVWDKSPVKRTPAEWALRWVWNHPEVLTVLSGMNTMEMIDENIKTASSAEALALTDFEHSLFKEVKQGLMSKTKVLCTGCNYCMPCPQGVDIPLCFDCYNSSSSSSKLVSRFYYIFRANNHNASLCINCGKCEKHCPQKIAIREELGNIKKYFGGPLYKPMRFIIKKFMKLS